MSPRRGAALVQTRWFWPGLVALGLVRCHEFDRALLTPVPWGGPVLRAVFACACSHRDRCGWEIGSSTRVEQWARSTGCPAPLCTRTTCQHRIPGWLCSIGEPREQAHLPAEQPSSGQDPRLPPTHAHPRRPRHSGCPSPQGPLRTVRLRLYACSQRVIVCEAAPISQRSFEGRVGQVDLVRAAVLSWCMPTQPTRARVNRRGSVSWFPGRSGTRWSATARSGSCGRS
jgi:hypothetical protein